MTRTCDFCTAHWPADETRQATILDPNGGSGVIVCDGCWESITTTACAFCACPVGDRREGIAIWDDTVASGAESEDTPTYPLCRTCRRAAIFEDKGVFFE